MEVSWPGRLTAPSAGSGPAQEVRLPTYARSQPHDYHHPRTHAPAHRTHAQHPHTHSLLDASSDRRVAVDSSAEATACGAPAAARRMQPRLARVPAPLFGSVARKPSRAQAPALPAADGRSKESLPAAKAPLPRPCAPPLQRSSSPPQRHCAPSHRRTVCFVPLGPPAPRLIKLVRMLRASRILKKWETTLGIRYAHMALVKFVVVIALSTHWLARDSIVSP